MIYARKVRTTDPRFSGGVPFEVLCNGCKRNIYSGAGYLIYLGKKEMAKDQPFDFYCEDCTRRYFPEAK
ncbi:unnamed protein product, partial [marine sediment metagenome]